MTIVLVMSVFVGCGQTVEQNDSENTGDAETDIPGGNISLTLWGAEEDLELLAQIVDGFKKEYADLQRIDGASGVSGVADSTQVLVTV